MKAKIIALFLVTAALACAQAVPFPFPITVGTGNGSGGGGGGGLTLAGVSGDIQINNGASNLGALTPFTGVSTFITTGGGTFSGLTAGASTNTTNVATTQVTTNASYYPLMVSSSTNSNQAANLVTTFTYNPSTGALSTPGSITAGSGSATAGALSLTQGTTQSAGTLNITLQAPTAVTSYVMTLPGAAGTGLYLGTNSAGTVTLTQVALGTGMQTFLTTPSSANFFSAITDESGSGVVVGSASPTFTGSPLAPTQTASDNSTKVATTAYADRDSTLTYNAQTGTTYTLVLADGSPGSATSGVSMANASNMTLTVPANASVAFPVGWTIPVLNLGAGALTVAAAGGVTINAPNLTLGVNTEGVLHKTATNTWQFYGQGLPAVVAHGDKTGQTAAVTITSFTVGAADAEFIVSTNVLVTTSTTYAFTVTCAYTDEGNTARTLTFNLSNVGGTFGTSVANAGGAVPYEGVPLDIRCKTGTTITIATAAGGTYTAVTYNARGTISQIN